MSDKQKKRFYWLKLKEDFFEEDTIEWLEEQPNGKEYCLFYLKLCLKSLKTEGLLVRTVGKMMIPYDPDSLAKLTNSSVDTVKVAMSLFNEIGLIQILNSGEIYMNQLNELVGSETEAAKQKRMQRSKNVSAENILEINTGSQSSIDLSVKNKGNHNATDIVRTVSEKCRLEKELEKEIDIELEKEIKNIAPPKKSKAKPTRHKYGDYQNVLLSDEDMEKLQKEFPDWQERIERLSEYCASTGKTYKNYLATIRNWAKRDKSKPVKQTNGYQKNVRREKLPDWAQPGYEPPERKSYDISITEEEKAFD